jgi:hypothetical protein
MTKRLNKDSLRYLTEDMDAELRRLRFKVEQLEDKVREERRKVRAERIRADKHADELAVARQELMFLQEREVSQARRRLNGEMR